MSLESGHSFMGSAVGGLLTAAAYGLWCGLRPLPLLDIIAPLVPLGHAVGKIGCFLSGDGCYGPRSDAPWDRGPGEGRTGHGRGVHVDVCGALL
eukprot:g31441.t1